MNKKETMRAMDTLDACVDHAERPEVMLALDALRRALLALWQRNRCHCVDARALLSELEPLPALCREARPQPILPQRLCQIMYILCAPEVEPGRALADQCREQAFKIRRLRAWARTLDALLDQDNPRLREEIMAAHADRLDMMNEAFGHLLALYRGRVAAAASEKRSARQREIERHWDAIPYVSDAVMKSRARLERAEEKLSEFAAEISSAEGFISVTGTSPRPTRTAREPEKVRHESMPRERVSTTGGNNG